jgi:hypothetical protein
MFAHGISKRPLWIIAGWFEGPFFKPIAMTTEADDILGAPKHGAEHYLGIRASNDNAARFESFK